MPRSSISRDTDRYIAAIQKLSRASIDPIAQSAISIANTPTTQYDFTDVNRPGFSNDPGIGSRIIDVLSRPLYASANVVKDAYRNTFEPEHAQGNSVQSFWEGLSGQKKTTYADVVGQAAPDAPHVVKAGLGLVGDILLDPTNLIAGGAGAALKAARGTKDVTEAARIAEATAAPVDRLAIGAGTAPEAKAIGRQVLELEGKSPKTPTTIPDRTPIEVNPQGVASELGHPDFSQGAVVVDGSGSSVPGSVVSTKPHLAPDIEGIDPNTYDLAIHHVVNTQSAKPSELQRVLGVSYKDSMRILSTMHKEGIVGKPFRKETKGGFSSTGGYSTTRPVLIDNVDNIPSRKIADSNAKVDEAAVVANAAAPDTVQPLPVENVTRDTAYAPRLDSIDLDKLGTAAMRSALPGLKDANGKFIFAPGRSRAAYLRSQAIPKWKSDVEAAVAQGAVPKIKATDGTEYVISTPHALDMLPPGAVEDMMYGARYRWSPKTKQGSGNHDLFPSQVNAGMAESLRLDDLGIPLGERYGRVSDAMAAAQHANTKRTIPRAHIEDAARIFVDNTQSLRQAQYEAAKAFTKKDLQDAGALSENAHARVINSIQDPAASTSQVIHTITSLGRDISNDAKAVGASDNAASIASQQAAETVGKIAPEADTAAARAASNTARVRGTQGFTPAANEKVSSSFDRAVPAIDRDSLAAANSMGIDTVNISNKVDVRTQGLVQAMLHPIRSRFSYGYGTGNFAQMLRNGESYADKVAQGYHIALNDFTKKYGRDVQNQVFSAIKRNETPVENLDAFNEARTLVDYVFDTTDAYHGAFWRTGAGIGEINRALASKGLGKFSFVHEGRAGDIADQWRQWDITDMADFLDRTHGALTHLAAKKAAGIEFSKLGSAVPKPGLVKIDSLPDSMLGNFIDKSRYYDKETAEMFSRLEDMLKQPHSFKGQNGAIASIVNNVIDPFLQLWKPFVTIIRPGHHVRNGLGDGFMTALDGMLSFTSYKRAMHMLAAGGQLHGKGLEGLKELTGALKEGGALMSTVRLKGKNVTLSYDNGYQLATKHGLLQTFRRSEDFDETGTKLTDAVLNSLPLRIAGAASEKISDVGRLAHFERLMRSPKFTRQFDSVDAAAESAAQRVRRFHPDSRGLTPFESKYMRRLIPFYSWIRQAFPVVVTTALSKPGRVTELPKASYNAAIAAGMDPDSLSDQFPSDTLYPSFVTDTITGPIGSTGYNLGSPQEGILGDILNGNPARNVGSMLNPLIKAPIELTSDQSIGTGSYIADKGEYIDQMLPGVNQVANISGYSPTGSLGTLAQGLGLDPQRAMARGEKEAFFNTSLANFLTGLGIQEYNKPSYQKIAGKELKTQ